MKRLIKKILQKFHIEIKRTNPETVINLTFDEIYKKIICKSNPIIIDVGANKGQSIERFKSLFPNSTIHAFEPIKYEYTQLQNKYENDNSIKINNYALGEKKELKEFYVTTSTGNSSFNKIREGTDWIKKRSLEHNTSESNYTKDVQYVNVITLDSYCMKNSINNIDIIKIDTQGYEDKVLEGCKDVFQREIVLAIETEIMFDDVYDRYLTFTDIEKNILPYDFRFSGIDLANNNLFEGIVFFANLLYIHNKK